LGRVHLLDDADELLTEGDRVRSHQPARNSPIGGADSDLARPDDRLSLGRLRIGRGPSDNDALAGALVTDSSHAQFLRTEPSAGLPVFAELPGAGRADGPSRPIGEAAISFGG